MKTKAIILKPLYTEKMAKLQESLNKYSFQVNRDANKIEIKSAIESKYSVKVQAVHTINVRGKIRQQFTKKGKFSGRRPDWKKAIITLEHDYKLELFDNA